MKKEIIWIVLLSISAAMLLALHIGLQQSAVATTTIKDRDYQLVTGRLQDGGEGLYVTDVTTGVVAVFAFDAPSRSVVLRRAEPVAGAFVVR